MKVFLIDDEEIHLFLTARGAWNYVVGLSEDIEGCHTSPAPDPDQEGRFKVNILCKEGYVVYQYAVNHVEVSE